MNMNNLEISTRRSSSFGLVLSITALLAGVGVAQVGEAIDLMDPATQQNAALVDQSAAAAESLKRQSHQWVQTVAVFKIDTAHAA